MITSEEREKAFREDFEDLLREHNASTEIYHDSGQLEIVMWALRDKDDKILKDFCNFVL